MEFAMGAKAFGTCKKSSASLPFTIKSFPLPPALLEIRWLFLVITNCPGGFFSELPVVLKRTPLESVRGTFQKLEINYRAELSRIVFKLCWFLKSLKNNEVMKLLPAWLLLFFGAEGERSARVRSYQLLTRSTQKKSRRNRKKRQVFPFVPKWQIKTGKIVV